jgi:hypothetical protein
MKVLLPNTPTLFVKDLVVLVKLSSTLVDGSCPSGPLLWASPPICDKPQHPA